MIWNSILYIYFQSYSLCSIRLFLFHIQAEAKLEKTFCCFHVTSSLQAEMEHQVWTKSHGIRFYKISRVKKLLFFTASNLEHFLSFGGKTNGMAFTSGPRLSKFYTVCIRVCLKVKDLPFSRYGSLPLTNHGDDSVCAHIQGDVPKQRVAGCCRSKGHTFLDCRSGKQSQNKRSGMWWTDFVPNKLPAPSGGDE